MAKGLDVNKICCILALTKNADAGGSGKRMHTGGGAGAGVAELSQASRQQEGR